MSVVRCVADASLSYLLPPLSAPPFTIQRLSELILQPTLYHTPTKYLSAIRRVLSVTAERDSFPILDKSSTIDETAPLDLNVNVNGILNSAINGDGSSPAFHPNSLFQSTSGELELQVELLDQMEIQLVDQVLELLMLGIMNLSLAQFLS